jgi:predicted enzyme related to lactoylglutathione lyase
VAARDPNFVGVIEIGITVADLDACSAFYQDVIGLEHLCDLRAGGSVIRRFAHRDAVVKLWQDDEAPRLANPPRGYAGRAAGLRYFTLQIDDVAETVGRCASAGLNIPTPLTEFRPGVPYAVVEDPEGNWLELTETPR